MRGLNGATLGFYPQILFRDQTQCSTKRMGSEFGFATGHLSFTMKSDFDALVYSIIKWGIRYFRQSVLVVCIHDAAYNFPCVGQFDFQCNST